jgi:integrase
MARPRKDYRVKQKGYQSGRLRYELLVEGQRYALQASEKAAAEIEGAELYRRLLADKAIVRATPGPIQPARLPQGKTLRAAITAYFGSEKWRSFKPGTHKQQRSSFNLIMKLPAPPPNRHVLADSLLADWLAPGGNGRDAVLRVMASCGSKSHAANHRLGALHTLFGWLLSDEPDAAEARTSLGVSKAARNPCDDIDNMAPRRDGQRRGHRAFTDDDIMAWLHASADDWQQNWTVRLMQIIGPRVSDLHRLNRGMIRSTPDGRVLTFKQTKGSGSMYRDGEPPDIVVPMVPELEALIAELPADRFCFIHSEWDQPFKSAASMSMKVQKWRKECGLPEGLSAHGMRKSATHWWLDHYGDLLTDFTLKAIFGWITTKELERYTRDYNRARRARGLLIRLSDHRPGRDRGEG